MSTPDRRILIADTAITTVATVGLRGLTHRAIDAAAALPPGSTSYYFRTRTALISACYARIAELDLEDFESSRPVSREAAAAVLGKVLCRWLTTGRERQLARYELTLEAARTPELEPALHRAGLAARARAAAMLEALGAARPAEAADLLVAWTEGVLYDRLVGATARTRPVPGPAQLTTIARRMLDAALAG
ncbi:TetR/AcrR family transcriptional regulator [Streptomyces sp. G-G2]|uniref:TetR/AcrR family transcriptional regulator n=1 Tax=Streptomyces sp. G-G2 TaxID=3046201 RepID=UPI0024B9F07B|nr:TetR/AcrR family transcriptional regulator [Streptomyces sp. G-G2]MDJ0380371.1 TetR family transcriptional regulator [Streptomyces sp. G-G2]